MDTCEAANQFGWLMGLGSGLLADIVIVVLVAAAPALGPGRTKACDRWSGLRFGLRGSLGALLLIWCGGGYFARPFLVCYADDLAYATAAMFGPVLLLAMVTAANQIGRRSVQ